MSLKDMFTLTNVRKDFRFFIHRLIIGLILALIFSVDVPHVLKEIDPKRIVLLLTLLLPLLIMYIVYLCKPKRLLFKKAQAEGILFCQSLTSIIRSAMVLGISALLYNIFMWNDPLAAFAYIAYFLIALEAITEVHFDLKNFDYESNDSQEWITIIVTNKDDQGGEASPEDKE